jgi:purine nucleoside permease
VRVVVITTFQDGNDWAFQLTKNTLLPDDSTFQQVRAGYRTYPNALKPPFVLEGDDLAADTFWLGDLPGPKMGHLREANSLAGLPASMPTAAKK